MRRAKVFFAACGCTVVVTLAAFPHRTAAQSAGLTDTVGMVVCSKDVDGRTRISRGTGAVVGSRSTVLTVAHNFVSRGRRSGPVRFEATDCVFRQLDAEGETIAEVAFESGVFGDYSLNFALPNEDWAVLKTAEPLVLIEPLPFSAVRLDEIDGARMPIELVAFRSERWRGPTSLMFSTGELFTVDYIGVRRLAHTAETDRMSSGAAIVATIADGRRAVVGIHRSSAEFG
ncbi:MAG: hypothetical protein R3305_12465, partial [Gammaproteobacteria bacterium]|nr:hypothetical protein [Gammaproteobacteria bacterium]